MAYIALQQGHRHVPQSFSAIRKSAKPRDLPSIKTHKHIEVRLDNHSPTRVEVSHTLTQLTQENADDEM